LEAMNLQTIDFFLLQNPEHFFIDHGTVRFRFLNFPKFNFEFVICGFP
jgi:hypothetical protein